MGWYPYTCFGFSTPGLSEGVEAITAVTPEKSTEKKKTKRIFKILLKFNEVIL